MKKICNPALIVLSIGFLFSTACQKSLTGEKWPEEKAWEWYNQQPWFVGTNFVPNTAINPLEMWQAETFDPVTIDRELRWSADLGMNMHRVFLHNLVWEQDNEAFLDRVDQFLTIADQHGIKTMLVLFDDVWDPLPQSGPQREPVAGRHNSGWVQSPGRLYLEDSTKHVKLETYVKSVMRRFKNDPRVSIWDIYNEPGNSNGGSYGATSEYKTELPHDDKLRYSLLLVKKCFKWAREVNPSQPITMGIWEGNTDTWGSPDKLSELNRVMIENSDIVSFHTYDSKAEDVERKITQLKLYGRPIMCTEYMARSNQNTFYGVLPILKREKIGAMNWGLVAGKTNTIYPWSSWDKAFEREPEVWFHDILRVDGTPYDTAEVDFIKSLTRR